MLTERQREIYDFIIALRAQRGYPPTVREIGEAVGLASPSTVHAHLAKLEQRRTAPARPDEAARARARRSRRARPRRRRRSGVRVLPLVGQIAAGAPLLAEQNIEDYLAVPAAARAARDEFLLRVRGDSMIEAGIIDGDYVVVQPAADAPATATSWPRSPATSDEGDGEAVLPREGPHPPAAGEPGDRGASTRAREVLGKVVGVFRSV